MNSRNNNNRSSGGNNRRGGGGRNNSRINTSNFPVEQGIICSLKESFGFIHCAERPIEVFFHYSQVQNCHPDDLQIDTEVEFKIGSSSKDDTKLAAYEVITLKSGTVVWETEPEPNKVFQGLVEKSSRTNDTNNSSRRNNNTKSNNSNDTEGTIRVLLENQEESNSGPLVRFRHDDYLPGSRKSNRLSRGDLVEFRLMKDHRTKQKYARYIKLVQTEKERTRIAKEQKLLENAVEEEGVVVSLNNGYGFLKSNKRREHVFFHYSNLILPEDQDDFELQKGHEFKFLVVTEKQENGQDKCSARQLESLPNGTVVFSTVVQKGIQGIVEVCPHPPIGSDDRYGTIRLVDPIYCGDKKVESVLLEFSDAPGGTYTFKQQRSSSAQTMGLWIENGDTLLFDVVKELADGSYRAAPTLHTLCGGVLTEEPKEKAAVRLVAASLVHRADGVVHTVHQDYGFLHFSERPIDVHFKTFNFLPQEIQSDLRKQLGYSGDPVPLEIGTSVQFDICAHGTVHHHHSNTSTNRKRGQERENIKGHRVLLLPKEAVVMDKVVKKNVKGVVKSVDPKQLYAGFVTMEETVVPMTLEERHPLVAQMIHSFLQEGTKENPRSSLVFRDVLSVKDDNVVVEMVQLIAPNQLECAHIPVPGTEPHPGRLCIRRRVKEQEPNKAEEEQTEEEIKEEDDSTSKKKKQQANNNKGNNNNNNGKNLRFDKSCLSDDLKDDVPPGVGDVVSCDVLQSRRTGRTFLSNVQMVTRNTASPPSEITTTGSLGIVKDVVVNRNFGFISVLDETATIQDVLFFSLSSAKGKGFRKGDEVTFDIATEKSSGKRVAQNVQIVPQGTIPHKAAKNACQGYILMEPTHTSLKDTPSRGRKGFSKGNSSGSSSGGGGRWKNDDDTVKNNNNSKQVSAEGTTHEEGCILLLQDKAGMFKKRQQPKQQLKAKSSSNLEEGEDDDDAKSVDTFETFEDDDAKSIDSLDDNLDDTKQQQQERCISLAYKNGAIAIHGIGSSSSMDGSTNPKRGDLVSFVRSKKGKQVRDVRIVTRKAATFLQGRLQNIQGDQATFVASTSGQEEYPVVDLKKQVISCNVNLLKENETVEAILHLGQLYGICRTSDLYLESKLSTSGKKERPKLNLTVKKNRGGTIMAQSMMAKGPDGSTNGFAQGWTTRTSRYETTES